MSFRWVGHCHGCRRDGANVETRYEHGARPLCDECAARARSCSSNRSASPTSAVKTSDVGRCLTKPAKGEVGDLLKAWRAGEKIPERVARNPLPADAPDKVRRVAELFLVVIGLRRGELIDAPVMFTERWVAEQPELEGVSHATAGRAILKLRSAEYAFVYVADVLPAKAKNERPTFLYELCPVPAVSVERGAGVVGEADEPEMELVDESLVAGTELAADDGREVREGDSGAAAARGGAGVVPEGAAEGFARVHVAEPTTGSGGDWDDLAWLDEAGDPGGDFLDPGDFWGVS